MPKRTSRRTKQELWQTRVKAFRQSGLSVKHFCRENKYKPAQINYWLTKFQTVPTAESFIEVPSTNLTCQDLSSYEIRLQSGIRIAVTNQDALAIARLIKELERSQC